MNERLRAVILNIITEDAIRHARQNPSRGSVQIDYATGLADTAMKRQSSVRAKMKLKRRPRKKRKWVDFAALASKELRSDEGLHTDMYASVQTFYGLEETFCSNPTPPSDAIDLTHRVGPACLASMEAAKKAKIPLSRRTDETLRRFFSALPEPSASAVQTAFPTAWYAAIREEFPDKESYIEFVKANVAADKALAQQGVEAFLAALTGQRNLAKLTTFRHDANRQLFLAYQLDIAERAYVASDR